jgi:hypothetical protein
MSMKSFEFANDHDDRPTVGVNVGVLDPATSIGGTRRRVDSGGSLDLKLEGLRGDTRFIQVRVARVATLRPVLCSISRPTLGVIPGGIH